MPINPLTLPLLTSEECDDIVKKTTGWVEGTVYKFGQFLTNKQFRSVLISTKQLGEELEDKIFRTVFKVNSQSYRYHLEGFHEKDPPLVFKYSADREDHYVWHTDAINGESVRKLSFTIQLSDSNDYKGGDLEFMPAFSDSKIRQKGNITIFPSYMTHKVTPIESGTRFVIVGWVYGPEFR